MDKLVSIITVSYNAIANIEPTIASVASKIDNNEVEYLVIDGGSSDGTVNIIKKYEKKISYWISEKDNGIYDAMNKGIARAKGKFVCFINAGDELLCIPLEELKNNNADLLCFPVNLSNSVIFFPRLNQFIKIRNTLPHQGCFYKVTRQLKFDENYKVFADFSLNQQLYKQNKQIKIFNEPVVATHSLNGISHNKSSLKEIFLIVKANFGQTYWLLSRIYFKYIGLGNKYRLLFKNKKNQP